ncbi:MAG: hypothetical protein AAB263_00470 [Planctomycetota bacterium]
MSDRLKFENQMVLAVVQALLGAVSQSMTAISITTDLKEQSIELMFACCRDDPADAERIDDIVTDLDAILSGQVLITPLRWIGVDWTKSWPGRAGRMVYAAAGATSSRDDADDR